MANELTEHDLVTDSAAVPVIDEPTGESAQSSGSKGEGQGQHKVGWLRSGTARCRVVRVPGRLELDCRGSGRFHALAAHVCHYRILTSLLFLSFI